MANGHVPLEGSERQPLADARKIGPVPSDQTVRVTVTVRRRAALPSPEELGATPLAEQHVLSRAELAEQYGADPADLDKVEQFATEHGLEVLEKSPEKRTVVLQGKAPAMSEAFQVELAMYARGDEEYRSREGNIHIPAELADIVEAVVGLDAHPLARPHFRRAAEGGGGGLISPHAAADGFSPVEIAQLYDFPADTDGSGETIAIIELGGGFRDEDLDTYFDNIGVRRPSVTAVEIGTAQNSPSTPDSADGEVMLDIEVAGAVAPGANQLVYFANNTTRGFLGAIQEAVYDQRGPSVISISWGAPEDAGSWTPTNLQAFDDVFRAAAQVGVTICVAAGDNGSTDGVDDGRQHVDFPASHPFVIACGGTRLEASNGAVTEEVVWENHGATGGGISTSFTPPPSYQDSANLDPPVNPGQKPGRGVPDVAGDAAPDTGYQVRVDGEDTVIGGTSAVAPLFAGLVARLNQSLRPSIGHSVGFLNAALYAAPQGFSDITQGNNGQFHAHEGWDACTGLGRPIGTRLLEALGGPVPTTATQGGGGSSYS
jgi:kumamolisin